MALIANSNTFNSAFVPAAGDFIVQVVGQGKATLERRDATAAPWALVDNQMSGSKIVSNPVAGAEYQWTGGDNVAVRADQ